MEVLIFIAIGSVLIVILKRVPAKGSASKNLPDFVSGLFKGFKKEEAFGENESLKEGDKKQELLEKALKSLKDNKLKEAENYYIEVLKIDQKDPSSYKGLGQICFKNKNYKDALDIFQKLIELTPNDPSVYCNLGMCHFKEGDFKNALKNYNKALSIEKKSTYFDNLAITLFNLKKYQEAAEALKKALKIDKEDRKAKSLLVKILPKIKNKKDKKNIENLLLKLDPRDKNSKK